MSEMAADKSTVLDPKEMPAKANWMRLVMGSLTLSLLVAVGYWPSLRGGFVWDDLVLVKQNPLATGELNLRGVWFAGDFSLSTVATWIEWLVFGSKPLGYRLVNLSLHWLSAFMAWRVLVRLAIPGAWAGAALFAVHPVAVASVAWISELKNTLSLPFFLLSCWLFWVFHDTRKEGKTGRSRLLYALAVLSFLLGLLAKTSIIMLPIVLLIGIWWREGKVNKQDLKQLSPFFLLALAFGLATIWFQSQQAIRGTLVQTEGFGGRLALAGQALWFYLGKAILPVHLCMIYPRWEATPTRLTSFVPLLCWLSALGLAWQFRRRQGRPILFALTCFTSMLFPVLGFFDMYFMVFSRVSDHLCYLPLLAITPLVAAGISSLANRPVSWTVFLALILSLVGLTWKRSEVFANDEALWRDTVTKNPNAWNAHNNLACNLAERGEIEAAIPHFETSLQLNSDNAQAHRNLGKALSLKRRFAEAESHFRAALKLKPDDAETMAAYATALAGLRRSAEAIALLEKALSIKPDLQFRQQLSPLLATTGRYNDAVAQLQRILEAQPDSVEALNNLAWIRATSPEASVRDGQTAVQLAKEACRLTAYKQAHALATLAAAYAEAGDFTNAATTVQIAIDVAAASGNEQFAAVNRQLQRLYQSGRAFHTAPIAPPPVSPPKLP